MTKRSDTLAIIKEYFDSEKYKCDILKESFDSKDETLLKAKKINGKGKTKQLIPRIKGLHSKQKFAKRVLFEGF